MGRKQIAIVMSHPVQHFVPLYRTLAARSDIMVHVYYQHAGATSGRFDPGFGAKVKWDFDLTSGYPWSIVSRKELWQALERSRPDLVFISGYTSAHSILGFLWCLYRSRTSMLWGESELLQKRSLLNKTVRWTYLWPLFKIVRRFGYVGDENRRYYRHYGVPENKLVYVPFTIDEQLFAERLARRDEIRQRIRAKYQIRDDDVVFLFVGKLIGRKRPADLVRAIEMIAPRWPNAKALFVGSGADEHQITAGPQIIKAGFVNLNTLPDYYLAADALVHPASSDPHPLVFSEAALCGLPIVSSDRVGAVGANDIAVPDFNALIFPYGQADALAQHLETLMDSGRRAEFSRNSREVYGRCATSVAVRHLTVEVFSTRAHTWP